VGTKDVPDNAILDFVCETIIAQVPLDQAKFSIVEIRTLGGAVRSKKEIPSGNCHHQFFVDMITLYDAKEKTVEERKEIADLAGSVVNKARKVSGLSVDFSGTHSQPDDAGTTVSPSNIFGSEVMANKVKELKKELDPENRFRFHPFAKIL
jgi:hypothetical protein